MGSAFDRTRRWLANYGDPDRLAQALAATHVELVVPRGRADAEIAAALAATLLLRLDEAAPVVHLVSPTTREVKLPRLVDDVPLLDALAAEHNGFAAVQRLIGTPAQSPVCRLVFGESMPNGIAVATEGWRVCVGVPTEAQRPGNAISASYAGVLGAIEAVKAMLRSVGVRHRHLAPWTGAVSLWDFEFPGDAGAGIGVVDLSGTSFVGCGGIASATAWVLALLPLSGEPLAVDDDKIDGPNLNRHLTASHREAISSTWKVDAFGVLLDSQGARTESCRSRWQNLDGSQRSGIDTVVITVDDDSTRRDVQLDLPRLVLNAGNADTGLYRVTRHDFLHGACLRCISRADQRSRGPEESAARRMGLRLEDIEPHLVARRPLPESLLVRAILSDTEREQLRGLEAHEALGIVCGQFSPLPELPAMSMPALSAAPGVLLAGALVKSRQGTSVPLNNKLGTLTTSLLAGPHARWVSARGKQPGCECADEVYRAAYRRQWAVGA